MGDGVNALAPCVEEGLSLRKGLSCKQVLSEKNGKGKKSGKEEGAVLDVCFIVRIVQYV